MKAFLVILLAFSLIPVSLGYTLGGTTFKGDVDMYGNNLSNLTTPVLDSDAATKAYADSVAVGGGLPTTGGSMTGQINFGGIPGYNIGTPVNDSDVSTKEYVDDVIAPFSEIEPSQLNYSLPFSSLFMDDKANITGTGGFLTKFSNDFYVIPEFFGAVGDNTTDDTAAIQDTINYAYLHNVAVLFGPRIYVHTGLQLYPGSNLVGVSGDDVWQTSGYASALRYVGNGVAINCSNSTGGYNYKIRIKDLAIIGPGYYSSSLSSGTGVYGKLVSEFQLESVTIKGFEVGLHGNGVSIGSIRNVDICGNDIGVYIEQMHEVRFDTCNFYRNCHCFDIKTAWNVHATGCQFELFDVGVYVNSSEYGDAALNDVTFILNSINNEIVYFAEPFLSNPPLGHVPWNSHFIEITDGGDYHVADDNVIIYGLNLLLNEMRLYKTDEFIEIDLQNVVDHGSSIKGVDFGNLYLYSNTSVYKTINSPYIQMFYLNSKHPDIGSVSAGTAAVAYGFDIGGWWGVDVVGGLCLPLSQINHEANIWYDPESDTVRVYSNGAVKSLAYVA